MSRQNDELATFQLYSTTGLSGLLVLATAALESSAEPDPVRALESKKKQRDVTTVLAHSTNSGQLGHHAMLLAEKAPELASVPVDTAKLELTASEMLSNLLFASLTIPASHSGLPGLPALHPAITASSPATALESALARLTAKPSDALSIPETGLLGQLGLAALSPAAAVKLLDNESTLAPAKLSSKKSAATQALASISNGESGPLALDHALAVTSSELDNTLAAEKTRFKLSLAAHLASTPTGHNGHLAHDATIMVKSPCSPSDSVDKLALTRPSSRTRLALLLDVLTGLSGATGELARPAAEWASENDSDDARATTLTA
jgi:hypothetical protein